MLLLHLLLHHSHSSSIIAAPLLTPPPPSSSPIGSTAASLPQLRLSHHKVNPAVAALNSPAYQLQMDEWAPYRMVFLLFLVLSTVALWASYKLLCESDELCREEVAYQPLNSLLLNGGAIAGCSMEQLDKIFVEEEEEADAGWEREDADDDFMVILTSDGAGGGGGLGQQQQEGKQQPARR